MPDKVLTFRDHPNHLINLVQASYLLGYADYRETEKLIEAGYLKAYQITGTNRYRVRYHDVMNLPTSFEPKNKLKQKKPTK
jgi:hypothetical protein